jgi:hypothetical protein
LPVRFARHFLEAHDAVVEEKTEGWDALLPGELAERLNLPELVSARRPAGARNPTLHIPETDRSVPLGYGSPMVEKMIDLAAERAPMAACRVHVDYLKKAGFDRMIADTFSFPNSMGEVQSHAEARTEYIVFNCWYQARSDEQQEGMVVLAFNLETGGPIPGMDGSLTGLSREFLSPHAASPPAMDRLSRLLPSLQKALEENIAYEIDDFRDRMKRRYRRDIRHLSEYYDSLRQEMENSLVRPGLTPASIAERKEKIALIPDELARKTDDLLKKYSIQTDVRPCAVLRILSPAVKLLFRLAKGRAEKRTTLFYNPIVKAIDPLVCEGCGGGTYSVWLCDRLHILCPDCRGRCPVCG